MEYINLGKNKISVLGIGTYPLSGEVLNNILSTAVDVGYNLIDTAHKYNNEKDIGNFIASLNIKNNIYIETKLSTTQLTTKTFLGIKYKSKTVKQALKESCRKLGVDILDIYLLHSPYNCVKLYGKLIKLRNNGMVDFIGGCRMEISHLKEIYSRYNEYPSINQIEVHPFYSNKKLIDFCRNNGIVVEARSPFTHGDALEEFIGNSILSNIAKSHNKTVPQIILRWIIQQGVVAIPRSSYSAHIRENGDIFDFYLTNYEMQMIDSLNQNKSYGCLTSK